MRSKRRKAVKSCSYGSAADEPPPTMEARTHRIAAILVGFAIVLGGCGSSNDEGETTSPAADLTTWRSSGQEAAALQGTWRTDPITIANMAGTLREAGLAESIRGFKRNAPISDDSTELVLEISDGTWNLYGQPDGGAREEIDYDARYEVDGDTVVVSHKGDSNTYLWSVNDDVLDLAWSGTTYDAYNGIPEEVCQRALYMTADFHRTP